MEVSSMERVGELLLRKSSIMQLMNHLKERAVQGDIKEIRESSPDISFSDAVLEEREDR